MISGLAFAVLCWSVIGFFLAREQPGDYMAYLADRRGDHAMARRWRAMKGNI